MDIMAQEKPCITSKQVLCLNQEVNMVTKFKIISQYLTAITLVFVGLLFAIDVFKGTSYVSTTTQQLHHLILLMNTPSGHFVVFLIECVSNGLLFGIMAHNCKRLWFVILKSVRHRLVYT